MYIIPTNYSDFDKSYLSIKDCTITIDISESIANIKVNETFVNPYNKIIEGLFLFPLPQKGIISNFSMIINKKQVQGKILSKNEARSLYEELAEKIIDLHF